MVFLILQNREAERSRQEFRNTLTISDNWLDKLAFLKRRVKMPETRGKDMHEGATKRRKRGGWGGGSTEKIGESSMQRASLTVSDESLY